MRYGLIAKNIGRKAIPWVSYLLLFISLSIFFMVYGMGLFPENSNPPLFYKIFSIIFFILGFLILAVGFFNLTSSAIDEDSPFWFVEKIVYWMKKCEEEELSRQPKPKTEQEIIDEINKLREELKNMQ
jgi:hypothetical protein